MEQETVKFIENVDAWVKQMRAEMSRITDVSDIVEENVDNIQHNYELILELRDNIEELRQEVNAMKVIQLLSLKQQMPSRY